MQLIDHSHSNMRRRSFFRVMTLLSIAPLCLTFGQSGYAHPGGLDKYGCHHDRKNGGYHCHGPSSSNPGNSGPSTPSPSASSNIDPSTPSSTGSSNIGPSTPNSTSSSNSAPATPNPSPTISPYFGPGCGCAINPATTLQTPSPSPTPSASPSATPTPSPSPTATPSVSPSPTTI